jgi:hypothetical protein
MSVRFMLIMIPAYRQAGLSTFYQEKVGARPAKGQNKLISETFQKIACEYKKINFRNRAYISILT